MIRRPFLAIYHFWTRPIAASPLALSRILFGIVGILMISMTLLPRVERDFGPDGLSPLEALEPWYDRTHRVDLLRGPQHVPLLEDLFGAESKRAWRDWGDEPRNARVVMLGWVFAIAGMTVGLGTRFCCLVVWALSVSFCNRLAWITNGGDSLYRTATFYLLIAPCGATWSVDARLRARRRLRRGLPPPTQSAGESATIAPWPVRLMQIQLVCMYLFTGLYKCEGDWKTGEAAYWILNDVVIARWSYAQLPVPMFFCRLASWGTLIFEVGFAAFVLFPRTRRLVLLVGVAFHAGIWATIEVGWFGQVCLCWYPIFVGGRTVDRLGRWSYNLLRPKTSSGN